MVIIIFTLLHRNTVKITDDEKHVQNKLNKNDKANNETDN